MTMQTSAENTEPVTGEPVPDATIVPPNQTDPGTQDPLIPTVDLTAGDEAGAGGGAKPGDEAGVGTESGAGTEAPPPVVTTPPGPIVAPVPKESQANGGAISKFPPTKA